MSVRLQVPVGDAVFRANSCRWNALRQLVAERAAFVVTLVVMLVVVVGAVAVPSAHAQESSMAELLERAANPSRSQGRHEPLPEPTLTPVNMEVHWRLWKRIFANGKPGKAELDAFRQDARSLGHDNLPVRAMAVTAAARQARARGDAVSDVVALYRSAQHLAPALPYPYLDQAAYLLREDPSRVASMLSAYSHGVTRAWNWLDTRTAWLLKLAIPGFAALLAASLLFAVAQTIRYFGVAAHDATRLLPRGFSTSQTVILLAALVIVPGLLLRSLLVSVWLGLMLATIFQALNERLVSAVVFAALALVPNVDAALSNLATYPGSAAQQLMHAQYFHCDAACREALEAPRADNADNADADPLVTYTALLARYRTAKVSTYEALLEDLDAAGPWPEAYRGHVANLRGAVLIALARHDDAFAPLEAARQALPKSAAPTINLMRLYAASGDGDAAGRALAEAGERNLEAMLRQMEGDRLDPNSYLMVEPLAAAVFWEHHLAHPREAVSYTAGVWKWLAGDRLPVERATYLGWAGLLVVLGCAPLRRLQRTSTPCPRCGLARDPRDAATTINHALCLPCYTTYVTSSRVDYGTRLRNETSLGRHASARNALRRLFSLVTPGNGHVLGGHALRGFVTLWLFVASALLIWHVPAVWRPPQELFSENWFGIHSLAWVVFSVCVCVGLNGALRGIEPTQVASRGVPHGRR